MNRRRLSFPPLLLLATACASSSPPPSPGGEVLEGGAGDPLGLVESPGEDCIAREDCPSGQSCDSGRCVPAGECGSVAFGTERLASNLMLVLDRSGSMTNETPSGQRRWDALKAAVRQVLDRYEGQIRFGLTIYSSCIEGQPNSAGQVVFPVADGAEGPIHNWLDRALSCRSEDTGLCVERHGPDQCIEDYFALPGSVEESTCINCTANGAETSTGPTLVTLLGLPELQQPSARNAVLLLTDGQESTGQEGPRAPEAAARLLAQEQPVYTYVVGLGDDVDEDALNQTARAGGTARDGNPAYYPASDANSLTRALGSVAGALVSCDYQLSAAPPQADGKQIFVYLDGNEPPLRRDATDGYTYDPDAGRLRLHGSPCEKIQRGEAATLDVLYGCAGSSPTIR